MLKFITWTLLQLGGGQQAKQVEDTRQQRAWRIITDRRSSFTYHLLARRSLFNCLSWAAPFVIVPNCYTGILFPLYICRLLVATTSLTTAESAMMSKMIMSWIEKKWQECCADIAALNKKYAGCWWCIQYSCCGQLYCDYSWWCLRCRCAGQLPRVHVCMYVCAREATILWQSLKFHINL